MSSTASSSSTTQLHFKGPYRRQNWSIPNGIIYYMAKNPSSATVYEKLIRTCKYFFSSNPIIVCSSLYGRDQDDGEVVEWSIRKYDIKQRRKKYSPYENESYITIDLNNASTKLWITHEIDICNDYVKRNVVSEVVPYIYRSDAYDIYLYFQDLTINELLLLATNAEIIEFHEVSVTDQNDAAMTLEAIVAALPAKVDTIYIFDDPNPNISSETVNNLLQIAHFRTLERLILSDIPETFDLNVFFEYAKTNATTYFELHFSSSISDAYKNRLENIIDEILSVEEHDYNYLPPKITFHGQDGKKCKKLRDIFHRFFNDGFN